MKEPVIFQNNRFLLGVIFIIFFRYDIVTYNLPKINLSRNNNYFP